MDNPIHEEEGEELQHLRKSMEARLCKSEWTSLFFLLSTTLLWVMISSTFLPPPFSPSGKVSSSYNSAPKKESARKVEINVTGAVRFPRVYYVPKGSLIKDLLKKAEPLPQADLAKIPLEKAFTRKRNLVIPERKMKKRKRRKGKKK